MEKGGEAVAVCFTVGTKWPHYVTEKPLYSPVTTQTPYWSSSDMLSLKNQSHSKDQHVAKDTLILCATTKISHFLILQANPTKLINMIAQCPKISISYSILI